MIVNRHYRALTEKDLFCELEVQIESTESSAEKLTRPKPGCGSAQALIWRLWATYRFLQVVGRVSSMGL